MVDSIVVVSALTRELLHTMCDLKAAQVNVQRGLIREPWLYGFELSLNNTETTKNFVQKGEGHS